MKTQKQRAKSAIGLSKSTEDISKYKDPVEDFKLPQIQNCSSVLQVPKRKLGYVPLISTNSAGSSSKVTGKSEQNGSQTLKGFENGQNTTRRITTTLAPSKQQQASLRRHSDNDRFLLAPGSSEAERRPDSRQKVQQGFIKTKSISLEDLSITNASDCNGEDWSRHWRYTRKTVAGASTRENKTDCEAISCKVEKVERLNINRCRRAKSGSSESLPTVNPPRLSLEERLAYVERQQGIHPKP